MTTFADRLAELPKCPRTLSERLRAAGRDERLATGTLYLEAADEIERLRGVLHEIAEVWAGSECGEPVTAQEGYAITLLKRIYALASRNPLLIGVPSSPGQAAQVTHRRRASARVGCWRRRHGGAMTDEDPGRCPHCGAAYELVRPGKSQPTCQCSEIERLRADLESCWRDVERYRWLLNHISYHDIDADWPVEGPNIPVLAQVSRRLWYYATDDTQRTTLDDAIKAAMKEQKP